MSAYLDELLRALDERIASVPLDNIPPPHRDARNEAAEDASAVEALGRDIGELRALLMLAKREQVRWRTEARRALQQRDVQRAREALLRSSEHSQFLVEAEVSLAELQALAAEVRRVARMSGAG